MKRFSWAIAVVVLGVSMSGMAQESKQFKVKKSPPEKTHKTGAVPMTKETNAKAASTANAKDLKAVEHQTAKTTAPRRSGGKKNPQFKPVKDKPSAPINFGAKGAGKNAGLTRQNANPYKGRLKQKHSH